jgi:NTP pyrophosphatase (non-canonical NTP hydrolase)
LRLGEAALRRLKAIEKETADQFALIENDHRQSLEDLEVRHIAEVAEAREEAYAEGTAVGVAAAAAAERELVAMRRTISWRATAALRAVRRAIRGRRP